MPSHTSLTVNTSLLSDLVSICHTDRCHKVRCSAVKQIKLQFFKFQYAKIFSKDLFLTKCLTVSSLINLSLRNQFGLKPGHSCINQPLSSTHKTFTSFDNGLEVRSVFFDLSKTFDGIWHKGLIFKLKQMSW